MALSGNFVNNGTLTQSSGDNFTFNGSSAQTISGSSKTTFEDLIINNSNGVTISSDTVKVNGSLELLNGTLTTGGKLKLLDAGTGIAPIKTIQGTGAISGEVTAQFYLGTSGNPLTKVDYRQLAIPLSGIQISDVQYNASTCPKCFYTYGFTGSNYPNVSWISFYKYDNTISMSKFGDGYIGPTSTSEPLEYKQGILFNGGPGTNGQSSYFMELSGEINSGNITLSTANGAKMNSNANQSFRYALVGNPYLSEITLSAGDFTSCGEGSGAMWVYEPDNGGYNTAKNTISPFQSFWVLMDASGTPSISITESDKTGSKASTLKSQSASNNQLIVKLKQTNSKTNLNYAAIRFNDQATNNMDYGYDVSDFQNPYPLPDISLVSEDDELLSTYVTSNDIDHVIIPIRTNTHFSGQHSITVDNLDQFDGCYMLEDKFENKLISLTATNNSYDFFLADTTKGIRFVLHKYNLVKKLETTNSTCFGDDNGSAELTLVNHGGTAPDKVQWLTSNGSLILDDYQAKGRSALNNLKAGNYSIAVESGTLNCAASKSFTIFEPGEMAPAFTLANSRNHVNQNEEIKFNNTSTGDILTYTWDFGDGFTSSETAPTHSFNQVGIFEVKLTASNGNSDCNVSSTSTVKVIERETTLGLEEILSNAGFNYVVANDILRLTFTEDISQDTPLKIISLQGQELIYHEILKGANSYEMDVATLPTIFLLQFDGESSYKSIKIAK